MQKMFYPSSQALQILRRKAEKARSLYEEDIDKKPCRDQG